MAELHPVAEVPDVRDTVKFLQAHSFNNLPKPWPRSQDLPKDTFLEPHKDDLVLAVSHAWPYGAHPDPLGNKQSPIRGLLDEANQTHKPQGKTLMFCDFLSVSQRPFTADQIDRTPEETANFAKALRAFPQIYLQADAVLHIDIPTGRVREDGQRYGATLLDLEAAQLVRLGSSVHVVRLRGESPTCVAPFDVVERIGNVSISCLEDVERAKAALDAEETATWWWSYSCSCSDSPVTMRRAPYGLWSSLSADQKGWVYLERFASMVKGAMVHEDHLYGVAFATSKRLLDEIRDGSERLREASRGGKEALNAALQYFVKELEKKQFSAVSVDKATNTGGVGGVSSAEASPAQSSDQMIVRGLMQELVGHLAENWEKEQQAQRQRQLMMAVGRGDVEATRQLIALGADPNWPDSQGLTCLHTAAKVRELGVVEVLIELRGDLARQDVQGNLPVHRLGLYARDETIDLFRALAPNEALLDKANKAGVTPYMRLAAWAYTAVASKPYPPAVELVEELQREHPSIAMARAEDSTLELGLERGAINETTEEYTVQGRPMRVHVWQPQDGQAKVHVLWLGFQLYMPPAMQQTAVRTVAEYACPRFGARLVASLEPFGAKTRSEYVAAIGGLLEVLPWKGKTVVVDNTFGIGIGVFWELRSRISAGLAINPLGWFSDEFNGSEAHAKMIGVVTKHLTFFHDRDIEGAVAQIGNYTYAHDSGDIDRVKEVYSQCLACSSSSSDLWWASQPPHTLHVIAEGTPFFKSLGALDGMPVVLLCGSHSPALLVQETVARLQGVIKNSTIEYIPNSKQWWEVEGKAQVVKVARTLVQILDESDGNITASAIVKKQLTGYLSNG